MLICQLLDFRRLIIWVLIFLFSGPVDAKKHKESEGGGAPSSLAPITTIRMLGAVAVSIMPVFSLLAF